MTTVHYRFERDSFTWLAYVMLAYYAFLQSSLGPLMPFLAAQLNMSYTVRGLHLSAFALGMMLAGTMADRAARRLGRRRVFWGGGVGMALAALALTTAGTSVVSIACAFLMGFIGSFLLVMIQATLADHHGLLRAVALTEANVGASVAAALAPLLVSQSEAAGIGWRVALVLGAAAWAVVFAWRWRMPITEAPPVAESHAGARRLPRQFWMYWLVVLLSVSVEWCVVFWGADFLEKVVGLSRVDSVAGMTAFLGAVVIGRFTGSRLTRRVPTGPLLLTAAVIVAVGFPVFWLARSPGVALTGLFILGLGVANLFPFTLSAATSVAPGMANTASARVSMGGGLAILVTPQILGSAADQIGIQWAFGIAGLLCVGVLVIAFVAQRAPAHGGG